MADPTFKFEEASGLCGDYLCVWGPRRLQYQLFGSGPTTKREFLRRLSEPLEKYEEYYERKYPDSLELVMKKAKPEPLRQLNQTVDEYNSLPLERKEQTGVFEEYYANVINIIKG